jgi:hypothetical protein
MTTYFYEFDLSINIFAIRSLNYDPKSSSCSFSRLTQLLFLRLLRLQSTIERQEKCILLPLVLHVLLRMLIFTTLVTSQSIDRSSYELKRVENFLSVNKNMNASFSRIILFSSFLLSYRQTIQIGLN